MAVNAAVENALATVGAILWCIQLLPQVWKSWRAKSTTGLSPWLMFTWMVSMCFLGTYNITQRLSIALYVQPQLCGTLTIDSVLYEINRKDSFKQALWFRFSVWSFMDTMLVLRPA